MTKASDDQVLRKTTQNDPTAEDRKKDHIELAFEAQINKQVLDQRFYYEPLLAGHPQEDAIPQTTFLGKKMRAPVWVSSMTGGTAMAKVINQNLAQACEEFGMGMGLGSCRALLYSNERITDFDMRSIIGSEQLLFANLGIAQLEKIADKGEYSRVDEMINRLRADGLIIHVNPLQEWLQPEGDRFDRPPLETIAQFLEQLDTPIIVKEVGQGMGRESLKALLQLPLAAIDYAAHGGTNFSKVELLRSTTKQQQIFNSLALVGHSAEEMVEMTNQLCDELGDKVQCKQVIISGGVKDFLDGYYLINKLAIPSVYGQASGFLRHARGDYGQLKEYVQAQVDGLALAYTYLKVR